MRTRMSGHPSIELALRADATHIASMSRDLIEHDLPWSWRDRRVAQAIADANTNVAVVREAGLIIAFGIMEYLEDEAHLVLFAVARDRQRQGIGRQLLAWLEESALVAGARCIRVEARRENEAARCFYNEAGYHEQSIERGMYSKALDGIRLERWLTKRTPQDDA
jgi:[ribosomal protein S18]-alanine N-acetyltransferase